MLLDDFRRRTCFRAAEGGLVTDVLHLSWTDYQAAVDGLATSLQLQRLPDLIIGVARGGLPLSVSLSHALGVRRVGLALAGKSHDDQTAATLRPLDDIDYGGLLLPRDSGLPKRVLLVDDIVAKGDVFSRLRTEVDVALGSAAHYHHATLFADTASLRAGQYADLLGHLDFAREVDNSRCWIRFPWERDA